MAESLMLAGGLVVLFDAEDADLVHRYVWTRYRGGNTHYARTSNILQNEKRGLRMHRLILDAGPNEFVDHRNGNGLDNQRSNLRLATRAQNGMNRAPNRNTSSRHKGVCWYKRTGTWIAYITIDGKRTTLGYYSTEAEAAAAYDVAAAEAFGEYARLNSPDAVGLGTF